MTTQLQAGDVEKSPEEWLRIWRNEQLEADDASDAIAEAIADMEAGDNGRQLRDVADDLRRNYKDCSAAMTYDVLVLARAERDLDEATTWIAKRAPKGAERWCNGFLEALLTLDNNP